MGFRKIFLAVRTVDQRQRLWLGAWGKPRQEPGWVRTRLDQGQQRVGENDRKLSGSVLELKGCGGGKCPGEGPGF